VNTSLFFASASAAGNKDSSATAENIKAFLSVDQVVSRIVCRIHVGCGGEKSLEEIVVRENGGD
jgi:hypothetical protein